MAPICEDSVEEARHVWIFPFTDGDTCLCGRFYLRRGKLGDDTDADVEFVIEGRPKQED